MRRKGRFTKAQADALLRSYRLGEAFGTNQVIEVEGVTFDLSCDIDPDLWKPVTTVGSYDPATRRHAPRIAFPWTLPEVITAWREDGEVIDAPAGSTVKVAMVTSAAMNPGYQDLDAEEHRERKLAFLWVFQPDGDVRVAEPPLMLLRRTATIAHIELNDYSRAFTGLVARLEQLLDVDELEAAFEGPMEDWPTPPAHVSMTHRKALLALSAAVRGFDDHAFAAFGYLMGRAEAEQQLLPLALREYQAAQARAKGGKARRSSSRARTEPLREQAKRVIQQNRNISLTSCAKAVAIFTAEDPAWTMSTDVNWISDQIRELFEKRDLNGKVEYRPKADVTG